MPYNPTTGIHSSPYDPVPLPTEPLSIFDFLFRSSGPARDDRRPWILDSADSSRSYTRFEALRRTERLATAFHHARGVRDLSSVVVFSPNDVDYGPCLWAAFRQGAVVSAANPAYNATELAYQVKTVHKRYSVKLLLCHPDSIVEAVKACEEAHLSSEMIVLMHRRHDPDLPTSPKTDHARALSKAFPTLDDLVNETKSCELPDKVTLESHEARTKLALLSFSSGTTGLPKGVEIPHFSLIANVLQATRHWENTFPFTPYNAETKKGDVVLACLPFYHIYGLVVVLHGSLYNDLPVVVQSKFSLAAFCQAIAAFRVSILFVVPPQIVLLVKQDVSQWDLSCVRMAMAGAAPLGEETLQAFLKKFPHSKCGQGYGMTETSTVISLLDARWPGGFPSASAGILIPNIEAKIVSPEGKCLGPGEIGELWARSPSNALGYLDNDKATRETFDAERFVHTGDECKIDEHGLLFILDRIKELIKSSGFQVPPAELEAHLLTHPSVQDVAVIGIPDERRGEAPKAYVVLSPSAVSRLSSSERELVDELKQYVVDHKVKYKALAEVEFVDAVPKTPSGKLLRKELRARHAQSAKGTKSKL
ncbi:hypothetical protein JCM10212_006896 [Sporobolomyces blumeae]